MIILKQSVKTIQNYATWIQIALLFILKVGMFMKMLQKMLKKDLIHEFMNSIPLKSIDDYLQEKRKKL